MYHIKEKQLYIWKRQHIIHRMYVKELNVFYHYHNYKQLQEISKE